MLVLIVNDESVTRAALENILASRCDVDRFDSTQDPMETLEKLSETSSRVLLLDINTSRLSDSEFLERGNRVPSIGYVTTHDNCTDSVPGRSAGECALAPVSNQSIVAAIARALQRTPLDMRSLETSKPKPGTHRSPQARIAIKVKGRILFINPADVIAVQAEGNYVLLQRIDGSYSLRESISVVEGKLRPYGFVQIHRSVLVNTLFVEEIKPCLTGEYTLSMKDGREYTVTRTYKKNLKALADSWIGNGTFVAE